MPDSEIQVQILLLAIFIVGLVLSGATAIPLRTEMQALAPLACRFGPAETSSLAAYVALQAATPAPHLSGQDLGGITLTPGVFMLYSTAFGFRFQMTSSPIPAWAAIRSTPHFPSRAKA